MRYGALEAGGTKMVLSVMEEDGRMSERIDLPTLTPEETMPEMIEFFQKAGIASLGVGCFGPLDLNPASPTYGSITSTPKLAWKNYPILSLFRKALHLSVKLDTDVNAAALAEQRLGAAQGLRSCVYVTIGTGVGGGIVLNGHPAHGLVHPEFGHQLLPICPEDPMPEGVCPYHKGCLEGLASGPALQKRWGLPGSELDAHHPAWAMEADYLAKMCVNTILMLSPEKIILGGGVMQQPQLFPMIRQRTVKLLGSYVQHPAIVSGIDDYIVPPGLGMHSGIVGAYLLAKEALEEA